MNKPILFFVVTFFLITGSAAAQLSEDFESGSKGSYAAGDVDLETGSWHFNDALLGSQSGDRTNGSQSARLRDGYIRMNFNKSDGADEFRFTAANAGFSGDSGGIVQVAYSTDEGGSWNELSDEIELNDELTEYIIEADISGDVRFEISRVAGGRISIDEVFVSDYTDPADEPTINVRLDNSTINSGYGFNFGSVSQGNTDEITFEVRNQGEPDLEISSVEIEGDSEFSTSGISDEVLGFGESGELDVSFSPESTGDYSGTLRINSNADNQPEFEIELSGTGFDSSELMSIADAREQAHGTEVTVAGFVTVADEFDWPVYIQDETAGISVFEGGDFDFDISIGDSIVVSGERGEFNGLEQIDNNVEISVYPENNRPVVPETITLSQFNTDEYQSQLVSVLNVDFAEEGTFSGHTNYDISDNTATAELRVDQNTELPGTPIPADETTVTGVGGHFEGTSQLLPRNAQDVGTQIISTRPYESAATPNSVTFTWETANEGTSEVAYGTSDGNYDLGTVSSDEHTTDHEITVDGLEPATIYHGEIRSEVDGDMNTSGNIIFSTASPDAATQEMNVYFNGSVNEDLATQETAVSDHNFAEHYIEWIESAEESIDVTFYNISQEVGSDVTDALIDARRSGIDIRVVMNQNLSNPADANRQRMVDNDIQVIQSGAGGRTQGIMHNKFAIIDYHSSDPEDIWVIVSSWNTTDNGTFQQYQNMIEFQDPALAGGYLAEFEQMWGGDGDQPDVSNARFGTNKSVVNPTAFWVDDAYIELYFSPQADAERRILEAFDEAQHDINVNTMGITRWDYRNKIGDRHDAGIQTRGVIGDINLGGPSADIFQELSASYDFHDHGAASNTLLHHKSAIVDGLDQGYRNGRVIAGSMNWSASGNNRNDENTIFIQNDRIANLYMQEFAARYEEAGGSDDLMVVTSTENEDAIADRPERFELDQNYPNPFNPVTTISFTLPESDEVNVAVYDVLGREVTTLLDGESLQAGTHEVQFDGSGVSSGVYLYRVSLDSGQQLTRRMTLVK